MYFEEDHLYHVYNMGNHKEPLFFEHGNFKFFLRKIERIVKPYCEILAYCLMTNHFHLMIQATAKSVEPASPPNPSGKSNIQMLARKIGTLQSSYTQAINKKHNLAGSLFRQKTKAKDLSESRQNSYTNCFHHPGYAFTCFQYIHQNPLKTRLVKRMEDWPYSSFREYYYLRRNSLCNIELTAKLLDLDIENFYSQSYASLDKNSLNKIF